MYYPDEIADFVEQMPILHDVMEYQPVTWLNPDMRSSKDFSFFNIDKSDLAEVKARWLRFLPYLKKAFPESNLGTEVPESALKEIPKMADQLGIRGKLLLKCDNSFPILPVSETRVAFYDLMLYAEQLASHEGLLKKTDDYTILGSDKFKKFFSRYYIGVSTLGNLGIAVSKLADQLGFVNRVYVSEDIKGWIKTKCKRLGAAVVEFNETDFGDILFNGNAQVSSTPERHFIDVENSQKLFFGYTLAASELAGQLKSQAITVDQSHPLCVYFPTGLGNLGGAVGFGLKQIYGDHVHLFFGEPTHSPSVLVGLATGELNKISVHDFGLDNRSVAEQLTAPKCSNFVSKISKETVSGIYTLDDADFIGYLQKLNQSENIFVEPSAAAGLAGPERILKSGYFEKHNINPDQATHIAWATGGSLVPDYWRNVFLGETVTT